MKRKLLSACQFFAGNLFSLEASVICSFTFCNVSTCQLIFIYPVQYPMSFQSEHSCLSLFLEKSQPLFLQILLIHSPLLSSLELLLDVYQTLPYGLPYTFYLWNSSVRALVHYIQLWHSGLKTQHQSRSATAAPPCHQGPRRLLRSRRPHSANACSFQPPYDCSISNTKRLCSIKEGNAGQRVKPSTSLPL